MKSKRSLGGICSLAFMLAQSVSLTGCMGIAGFKAQTSSASSQAAATLLPASWPGIYSQNQSVPISAGPASWMTPIAGASGGGASGFNCWGTCVLSGGLSFPTTGTYDFVVSSCLLEAYGNGAYEGLMQLFIDQVPVTVGSGFTHQVNNFDAACANPVPYTFTAPVLAGDHLVELRLYSNPNQLFASNLSVTFNTTAPALLPEPPGDRNPWLQPMSSWSIWNTSIGSAAVWSATTDPDTLSITGTTGVINSGEWSVPYYEGQPTDPIQAWHDGDMGYNPANDVSIHMPAGMGVAPPVNGGDHSIAVFDASNSRYMYSGFGCTVTPAPGTPGMNCARSQIYDMCNGYNQGSGQGGSQALGIIRAWELTSGKIQHMLTFGLATQLVAPVPTPWTGFAWPLWESDYNGAFGQYSGNVTYGSTIGIPSTVDVTSLGLTPSGLALAHALQDYGAIMAITGGEPNDQITIYAEESAEGMSQLNDMRNAFVALVPQLRILRNQSPATMNGGGTPRQPTPPRFERLSVI